MTRPKPRKRPTQARSKATVAAIIEAATRILIERGLDELTTNRVAEVAGVSVGSLYQYFPDKAAIVAGIVEAQLDRDRQVFVALLAANEGRPLSDQLDSLVDHLLAHQQNLAPLLAKLLPLLPKLRSEALAHQRFTEFARLLARLVTRHGDACRAELCEPERVEQATFLLAHGIRGALNAVVQHEPERLSDPLFVSELKVFVHALFVRPTPTDGSPSR